MFALALAVGVPQRRAAGTDWWLGADRRLDGVEPGAAFAVPIGGAMIAGTAATFADVLVVSSGSKRVIGPTGTLDTVAADTIALDWSTGRCRLPIEALAATNHIVANDGTGAVVGSPGTLPTGWSWFSTAGLTTQVVAKGTALGIPYVDIRLSGTATGASAVLAMGAKSGIAAGDKLCTSAWLSMVAGSTAGIAATNIETRWPSGTNTDTAVALSATPTRAWASGANGSTAGTAYPALTLDLTTGAAIDVTIRIGLPQLEAGLVPSSPIVTSGSTVTRIADDVRLSAAALAPANASGEATIALRGKFVAADSYARLLGDTGTSAGVIIRENGNDGVGVYSANGQVFQYGGASLFSDFGACAAYSSSTIKISKMGVAPASAAKAFPTLSGLRIFGGSVGGYADGYVDEVLIWPFVGSNAGVQAQARVWA